MRTQMLLHAAVILQLWLMAGILIWSGHMIPEALLIAAVGAAFALEWWIEYSDRWLWILRRNP